MANKSTAFQRLEKALSGNWGQPDSMTHVNKYDMSGDNGEIIFRTRDKDEYERTKLELQQNKFLKNQWYKANVNLDVGAFSNLNYIQLMYRDADLMDAFPEIGAALDTYAEESCLVSDANGGGNGSHVVNVYSKSERIKSIIEDLLINRLNLQVTASMVIRGMCKYGNQFMLLDIDNKLGVKGWRQLPVFDVERIEHGIQNPYAQGGVAIASNTDDVAEDADAAATFIWNSQGQAQVPFRSWQIGHFRLLTNSMYLPYGVSVLNSGRRHFRMLSLMEDMMFIYRLERSMERRIYKINVGAIDDADVPAYMEEVVNRFKRTPIIDPLTGQIDLRKNILPVHKDTPIPLLDGRVITIEELAKEYEEGKDNYVYSVQDKTHQIVPGKVVWCGKNYTADKLVKITLDDDSHMIMAPEHEIIMRDGSKKRADEVKEGESVMPLYRKVDKESKKLFDRYEKTYNPNSGKFEYTHRLIGKEIEKTDEKYNTIYHKDFNKYNNNPTNLMWMDYYEHHKMHGDLARSNWADPEKRKIHCENLSKACKGSIESRKLKFDDIIWDDIRNNIISGEIKTLNDIVKLVNSKYIDRINSLTDRSQYESSKVQYRAVKNLILRTYDFETVNEYIMAMKKNHKISSIEYVGGDDVYCMTVVGLNGEEDRHNFALLTRTSNGSINNSGVFVSNCISDDIFIPVRTDNAPNPVDTLNAGQNLTAMDDIKFVQNKLATALRIPKAFMNFDEATGDGKNLALMDIRFTRQVNHIQQAFLMELTKIVSIHLYLLGFADDITNFSLTMNNPSTQAEQLELENLQKKVAVCRDAISDPGNGIPIMSQMRALKTIMKWSEKDIKENLEEIRLERAIAAELEKTTQIIKRTNIFDNVDRMYGEPGAEYAEDAGQGPNDDMGGMGGPSGGGGGASFGSGLDDLGAPGAPTDGEIQGEEGSGPTAEMPSGDEATPPQNENASRKGNILNENKQIHREKKLDDLFEKYISHIDKNIKENKINVSRTDIFDKAILINDEFNKMIESLDNVITESK